MGWFWQEKDAAKLSPRSATLTTPESSIDSTSSPSFSATSLLTPENVLSTAILTSGILLVRSVYRYHLRRISNNASLPSSLLDHSSKSGTAAPSLIPRLRRQSLFGYTTTPQIADPDNFRFYHAPLGRLALWSTSFRPIPSARSELKGQTLSVRLAGIDAPELAHFGKPAQPHAEEALKHLQYIIADRGKGRVRVFPLRRDQYERVVGTAFVRRRILTLKEDGVVRRVFGGWRWGDERRSGLHGPVWHVNVGLEMVRRGWATVYEGKIGVEWGSKGMEGVYREAEKRAKAERLGIWVDLKGSDGVLGLKKAASGGWSSVLMPWRWFVAEKEVKKRKESVVETPREYKLRMKAGDAEHAPVAAARTSKASVKP